MDFLPTTALLPATTTVALLVASFVAVRKPWRSLTSSTPQACTPSDNKSRRNITFQRLAAAPDSALLPPVRYAYDPLPAQSQCYDHVTFPALRRSVPVNAHVIANSISLDPIAAGLPYRSSLDHVRASRYWDANVKETLDLLALLAADNSASDIEVRNGITLSRLARKALAPGREQQIMLATLYMFPAADEERIKHIAALMIIYFVFDDKVEETPNEELSIFRNDFLSRLEGHHAEDPNSSPLQRHIDSMIRGIKGEDAVGGNGGKEMVEALHGAFRAVRPDENGFRDVSDYLDFRRQNVGADFVIAAAKYSIKSAVDSTDPRFARLLHLVSDHFGLVNDLASYDKELRALKTGETKDMINLIHVIKTVTGLHNTDDAKAVAWALQLQMEQEMMTELEDLKSSGKDVTREEWWFLEAVITAATGNVMFCMTTSRYGGEAARI